MSKEHFFTIRDYEVDVNINSTTRLKVINIIRERSYGDDTMRFTFGDIAVQCGVAEALQSMVVLPESHLRMLMWRLVRPALERLGEALLRDETTPVGICFAAIQACIQKSPIDKGALQETSAAMLLAAVKETSGRPSVLIDALYHVTRALWDSSIPCIQAVVSALSFVLVNGGQYGSEKVDQLNDIINAFPPQCKKYHAEQNVFRKAVLRYRPNWLLRKIGFKDKDGKDYRFKWGSVTPGFGFKLEVIRFSASRPKQSWYLSLTPVFGRFWINLPAWLPYLQFDDCGQSSIRKWGIGFDPKEGPYILLSWKDGRKYVYLPWAPEHIRTLMLMDDGSWEEPPKGWGDERKSFDERIAKERHSFMYVTRSGEKQHRIATIHLSEREWRPRWTQRFPIFRNVQRRVEYEFSSGIGEKADSWKGGVTASSITLKYNELPSEALYRVESNEKF